jgi:hypothetical protein
MNRHHHRQQRRFVSKLAAAIGSLLATFALAGAAQEATPDRWMTGDALKSRAEVLQELAQARRDGSIRSTNANYDFVGRNSSSRSRADVRDEALTARSSGELAAVNAEAHDFVPAPGVRPATPVVATTHH